MIKLVIFDMDGVLIDSEHAITLAALEALKKGWGINADYADFKQFTGMGENKFIGGVAELYGVPYDLRMKDMAYDIYCKTARERVTVYGWSKPLIKSLVEQGYKVAVASAADMVKVRCNIECIGIDTSLFSAIITGSDVTRHKPDPEVFLKASEAAGISPSESLVFEDAVSGVKAAKAAGMKCIAVTTSFDRETLIKAGADETLDSLDGATDIIKTIIE
jgi:beta-phosphoglucomutase